MTDNSVPETEDSRLIAAEYVLGVLDAPERRAVEQRIARDQVFAREVAFWEKRLGGLAEGIRAVAPPTSAWARIEAVLEKAERRAEGRAGLWQSLRFWRGLSLVTSALAAACLAALIYTGALSPPRAALVAQLGAEGGKTGFVAAVNSGGGTLTIVPAALLRPQEQKAMELWLIPPSDKPHSLGLIDPNRPVTIKVPRDLLARVNKEAVLAVSLEPLGGSPTGQPTGPVIANGKLAQL